jgi:hypothetical protein
MASKNKTNRQNPTNKSMPAFIDPNADKRPDLGISPGGSGGGEQERSDVKGMIPETRQLDPNITDVLTSNQEGGTSDTVPGKREAARDNE